MQKPPLPVAALYRQVRRCCLKILKVLERLAADNSVNGRLELVRTKPLTSPEAALEASKELIRRIVGDPSFKTRYLKGAVNGRNKSEHFRH